MDECLHAVGWCHCEPSAPQGEAEPPTWQQAEDMYGLDAMRDTLRRIGIHPAAPQGEGDTDE